MTVIRIKHNRENPFVQINKEALWNNNLSLKAKGLWALCLSRPDDWCFHVSEIIKNTKEGRESIHNAINELISNGYAMRFQKKDPKKGNFLQVEYYFFEFPLTTEEREKFTKEFEEKEQELKKCLPHTGLPHTGLPHTENPQLLIKNDTDIDNTKILVPSVPEKLKFNFKNLDFENLSDSIIESWMKKFEGLDIKAEIEKAKIWIKGHPARNKKRKDWIKFFEEEWFLRAKENMDYKKTKDEPKEIDLGKIMKTYEKYKKWYENTNDPIMIDRGFLIIKDNKFYNTKNERFKMNLTYEKFLEVLNELVPSHILRILTKEMEFTSLKPQGLNISQKT